MIDSFDMTTPYGELIIRLSGPNSGSAIGKDQWKVNRIPHRVDVNWTRDEDGSVTVTGTRWGIRRTDRGFDDEPTWKAVKKVIDAVERAVDELYTNVDAIEHAGRLAALRDDIERSRNRIAQIEDHIKELENERAKIEGIIAACQQATAKLTSDGIQAWLSDIECQRERGRQDMADRVKSVNADWDAMNRLMTEVNGELRSLRNRMPSRIVREPEEAYLMAQVAFLDKVRAEQIRESYW